MVRAGIGVIAAALMASGACAQEPYHYAADTVDVNQGVYICDSADRSTLNRLAAERNDIKRRGAVAQQLRCSFHIGPTGHQYEAEEYPVTQQVAGVCYRGGEGFCEEQAYAVRVYMQGRARVVVALWLDEDRD